jgi:hypothetical protein
MASVIVSYRVNNSKLYCPNWVFLRWSILQRPRTGRPEGPVGHRFSTGRGAERTPNEAVDLLAD